MPVSLPGYSKNINPQTFVREGLEELRHTSKDKAQGHLAQLRNDLQTKTGVVRLLHTSGNNDKDMKFKNAGAFKSIFLDGHKLQQSAEVIRDLLKNAGLSDAKVNEFDAYVQARGGQGVKAQKVLQFIDAMRTETGASPAEALSKFGVDLGAVGRLLGAGAYGTAHIVQYRGEEFVYKQPVAGGQILAKLQLADASGDPIVPPAQESKVDDGEKSYQEYDSSHSLKEPSPLEKIKNRQVESEYGNPGHDRSNSISSKDSSNSYLSNKSVDIDFKNFQMFINNQGDADAGVVKRDSIDLESEIDQEPEFAAFDNSKQHLRIEEESEGVSRRDPLANAARAPVPAGVKLARSGMGNVARVKDLPQVITPTVLVVKEQASDGSLSYHAVAGQKTLKDWARTQATTSEFDVVGLLMPKAAGKTLRDSDDRMTVVSRADLKPMASSALNLLKGLASHGFIHGDIKPENLIWDTKSKTLQLIDNDSMKKVSKQNGSLVKAEGRLNATLMYLNPVGHRKEYSGGENEQLGLGRDLFAMGLTLLEASLHARGQAARSEKIIAGITFNDQPDGKAIYKKQFGNYDDGIKALMAEEFAPGSVDAFARSCIIKSIEHEKGRLGLDENDNVVLPRTATFDRYDPNRAGNDQHLLAQLERDLALLT